MELLQRTLPPNRNFYMIFSSFLFLLLFVCEYNIIYHLIFYVCILYTYFQNFLKINILYISESFFKGKKRQHNFLGHVTSNYFSRDRNRGWEAIKLTDRQMLYDNDTVSHWRRSHTLAINLQIVMHATCYLPAATGMVCHCVNETSFIANYVRKLAHSPPYWCFTQRHTYSLYISIFRES